MKNGEKLVSIAFWYSEAKKRATTKQTLLEEKQEKTKYRFDECGREREQWWQCLLLLV